MSDKKYTIHPIAHSHTDMNWLWPWEETIEVFRLSWENMLSFMDKYPWFVFLQSQPCVYEAFAPLYPEIFEKIQPHINSGNWCLAGGNWDESDTNMPRGEALARSILLGKQYFQTQFGVDIKMGWLPDSFGHSWQMPQILKLSEVYLSSGGKALMGLESWCLSGDITTVL